MIQTSKKSSYNKEQQIFQIYKGLTKPNNEELIEKLRQDVDSGAFSIKRKAHKNFSIYYHIYESYAFLHKSRNLFQLLFEINKHSGLFAYSQIIKYDFPTKIFYEKPSQNEKIEMVIGKLTDKELTYSLNKKGAFIHVPFEIGYVIITQDISMRKTNPTIRFVRRKYLDLDHRFISKYSQDRLKAHNFSRIDETENLISNLPEQLREENLELTTDIDLEFGFSQSQIFQIIKKNKFENQIPRINQYLDTRFYGNFLRK